MKYVLTYYIITIRLIYKEALCINNNVAKLANEYWNKNIPDRVKEKIVKNGWKIVFSKQKLKIRFGYDYSIAGLTRYKEKTIYLDNRESAIKRALIHEVGHAINDIYGWPINSELFKSIFSEEKHKFKSSTSVGDGHEIKNTNEYFAELFQEAIINKENCKKQVPKSFEFIMKYIN